MTIHHNIGTAKKPVISCNHRMKNADHVRSVNAVTCETCLARARRAAAIAKYGRITDKPHACHCGEPATRHDGAVMGKRKYGCAAHAPTAVYQEPERLIAWRGR